MIDLDTAGPEELFEEENRLVKELSRSNPLKVEATLQLCLSPLSGLETGGRAVGSYRELAGLQWRIVASRNTRLLNGLEEEYLELTLECTNNKDGENICDAPSRLYDVWFRFGVVDRQRERLLRDLRSSMALAEFAAEVDNDEQIHPDAIETYVARRKKHLKLLEELRKAIALKNGEVPSEPRQPSSSLVPPHPSSDQPPSEDEEQLRPRRKKRDSPEGKGFFDELDAMLSPKKPKTTLPPPPPVPSASTDSEELPSPPKQHLHYVPALSSPLTFITETVRGVPFPSGISRWSYERYLDFGVATALSKGFFENDSLLVEAQLMIRLKRMNGEDEDLPEAVRPQSREAGESQDDSQGDSLIPDVTLIFPDGESGVEQRVRANRIFLASHSRYFRDLFFGQLVGDQLVKPEPSEEITLHGVPFDDFLDFLEIIKVPIRHRMKVITVDTVEYLIHLALTFRSSGLLKRCERFVKYDSFVTPELRLLLLNRFKDELCCKNEETLFSNMLPPRELITLLESPVFPKLSPDLQQYIRKRHKDRRNIKMMVDSMVDYD